MRQTGSKWNSLQRWVNLAAVGTLLHWKFVHNNLGPALVHFVPLAALETHRIWKTSIEAACKPPEIGRFMENWIIIIALAVPVTAQATRTYQCEPVAAENWLTEAQLT